MKAPLLTYFGEPIATKDLKIALKKESSKIQLKGLVGSSFALTASAVVRESSVPHLFIFRDKEEASYFINDIELHNWFAISDFLGLESEEKIHSLRAFYDNSVFGKKQKTGHIQNGKAEQYKSIFTPELNKVFESKFPNALAKLGYL